jgi:hypothetical protein
MQKPYADDASLREEQLKSSRETNQEHFDEAIKALDDSYRSDADQMKTVRARVQDAVKHLDAIERDSSLYTAAKGLKRQAQARGRHMERVSVHVTNHLMIKQREMVASELEQYSLNRGILVDIELSGPEKMFMKLGCTLFCDTSVGRIVDETRFLNYLRKAGFKRVVFEDNVENVWTYSVKEP